MFNLASKARPYFGALVLLAALLTAGGVYSVTRMPSGVYPEITFPRIAVVARKPGTDMRRAEQLTWNRIGAARSQLPVGVEFTVEQMTPSVFPIMSVVLTGGDSPAKLRDYAYYQLAPQIKNIPDVLYCNVAGGDLREIVVEARPDDLLAAGLSAADLADQISRLHRLQPVGRVEEPPFAFQMIVNTQGDTRSGPASRVRRGRFAFQMIVN